MTGGQGAVLAGAAGGPTPGQGQGHMTGWTVGDAATARAGAAVAADKRDGLAWHTTVGGLHTEYGHWEVTGLQPEKSQSCLDTTQAFSIDYITVFML